MTDAAAWAAKARLLADEGDFKAASDLFDAGLTQFPTDARFANSAGNFYAKAGEIERAVRLFREACLLDPSLDEALYNLALMLLRLGKPSEVRRLIGQRVEARPAAAKFHAILGDAAREIRHYDRAQQAYATAISIEPDNKRALAGRARLSLERGEVTAVADYEAALARNPTDPQLFRNYSEALWEAGHTDDALRCAEALVTQLPDWPEGYIQLAEFRWADGARDGFDSHFALASKRDCPVGVYLAWAGVLSGVDRHLAAAAVLREASHRWSDNADVALSLGIALSEAEQCREAVAVFDRWRNHRSDDWQVARARNLLRSGEVAEAMQLLEGVIDPHNADISAWALIDLCWRILDDPRHEWLHGQRGLVQMIPLSIDAATVQRIGQCLEELHGHSATPIGQSVKNGQQTKGALFARLEPELTELEHALHAMLQQYRDGLPPLDANHPLLSRRTTRWSIVGSWSIRLNGQGRHAAHIHPLGLLSSACYFDVPTQVEEPGQPGWLELGRPPHNLVSELAPLHIIKPVVGSCAVFPSTLFHGTRPISRGNRMTVAFDVKPIDSAHG